MTLLLRWHAATISAAQRVRIVSRDRHKSDTKRLDDGIEDEDIILLCTVTV